MKIFIAGYSGMVGSAILRRLIQDGHTRADLITKSHSELDLTNQLAVDNFFQKEKPDLVYLAAARVGGILANNTFPADFIYENIMIEANVINAAFRNGVRKLLFLGSSCIYPRLSQQPIAEESLLSGKLEPTNEPYAIAKIAGIKLCESFNRQYGDSHGIDYRSVMPTNLYGPGDNYHPTNSHVIPGLIRRFHEAKVKKEAHVTVWGSGNPCREFLYVEDMAAASIFIMNLSSDTYQNSIEPMCSHINVGAGHDVSIRSLAELIKDIVGYEGHIQFDISKPDGTPKKLLSSQLINKLGWSAKVSLEEGLMAAYDDFLKRI